MGATERRCCERVHCASTAPRQSSESISRSRHSVYEGERNGEPLAPTVVNDEGEEAKEEVEASPTHSRGSLAAEYDPQSTKLASSAE